MLIFDLKQIFSNKNSYMESGFIWDIVLKLLHKEIFSAAKREYSLQHCKESKEEGYFPFYIAITIVLPTWLLIATLTHAGGEKFNLSLIIIQAYKPMCLKGKSIIRLSRGRKRKPWLKSVIVLCLLNFPKM